MFARVLQEHALEEGGVARATIRSVTSAAREYGRTVPRRTYLCYAVGSAWLLGVFFTRPMSFEPPSPPPVVDNPAALAPVYGRFKAIAVAPNMAIDDEYIVGILSRIGATMSKYNYTCLSATHIGVPIQLAIVNTTVLVNPRLGASGTRVSVGHETSAFYPTRPPKRTTRFVPATVFTRDRETPHVFGRRLDVHCVLHLLDQMDGLSPYDER